MLFKRNNNDLDLFEDFFDDPFFDERFDDFRPNKQLRLGEKDDHPMMPDHRGPFHHPMMHPMKTDIKELDDHYEIEMDLPGYEKDNISLELENGYLKITANQESEINEDKKGKFIHRERFVGSCSRSFYVGDNIVEEDIKASFKNGKLSLIIPKKEENNNNEKKYIPIDGE